MWEQVHLHIRCASCYRTLVTQDAFDKNAAGMKRNAQLARHHEARVRDIANRIIAENQANQTLIKNIANVVA